MREPILATKLFIPPPPPKSVGRNRLLERLNEGLHRKLTLVSAPAGFGKTTLISQWCSRLDRPIAWLSLDERDSDPTRFLSYLIAAVQNIAPKAGTGLQQALASPQRPSAESILTILINELGASSDQLLLVLDDYHLIDNPSIDDALAFLLEHIPPQMHVLISTREDPQFPLAGLRARGHLNELRAADLRFRPTEAAAFLNLSMGLNLSADDVAVMDSRTEGWAAGLQLAAISLQGNDDPADFIKSFSGSHRFVLEYLLEEVLKRQPESVLSFMRSTSILDRLCGPLCDAIVADPAVSGQDMLEYIERSNLFISALDNERRWYRYHDLFRELLQHRLHHHADNPTEAVTPEIVELHRRASSWFESQNLETEAFHHAVSAHDHDRAKRLIHRTGTPMYLRGGVTPVLEWLESMPDGIKNANPQLWVEHATVLSIIGRFSQVEHKLQAAEAASEDARRDGENPGLVGAIADLRELAGLLAEDPRQVEATISQSQNRPEQSHFNELPAGAAGFWKLGLAHQLKGDRSSARLAQTEAIARSETTGNTVTNILASSNMGHLQELDGQLNLASTTFRRVLQLVGNPPGPVACEAYVGLARISYEWNELELAEEYGRISVQLARQLEIVSFIPCEVFLARLCIARGDIVAARDILTQTYRDATERNFLDRIPQIAALQATIFIRERDFEAAGQLAATHDLPMVQARIHLVQGEPNNALKVLEPLHHQLVKRGWKDEQLKVLILQALANHARGDHQQYLKLLGEALIQGEAEGKIRVFVDEGPPMADLLTEANASGIGSDYTRKLLAAFANEGIAPNYSPKTQTVLTSPTATEPLSRRELEVLQLIAEGLSNKEIGDRLFLTLATVKGHNRAVFRKLHVQRRTEAIARGRELGLL